LFPSECYDEEQYNIDTSIDTIWVNAHNTVLAQYGNSTRVYDDEWSNLLQDSQNIWMSLPTDDQKLILGASDSVSSITKTSSSMPSRSSLGCRHQTFARNRDKLKVMFMDQQSEDTTMSTEPMTDSTDDDLVDDIMGQLDVDFDTLWKIIINCNEIYGACWHKTRFHRFLKEHTNVKNTSTDEGNKPETVYKYDD
jgi:hypothetical protein